VSVAKIEIVNHQVVVTGKNFNIVRKFKISNADKSYDLQIESKTNTSIVANLVSDVVFSAGKVFDFVLSNASAASTYTVNFSLCDSLLGGKGFNCLLVPNDKDVLSFDANTNKWIPRNVNGLAYKGTFDASAAIDPGGSPEAGDYYIINVAGTINTVSFSVGDWIVYNADELAWQKISNSNDVLSVYGRTGKVSAKKGDYNLTKMADVDLTTTPPVSNQFLKYNGTNWVPGDLAFTGGAVVARDSVNNGALMLGYNNQASFGSVAFGKDNIAGAAAVSAIFGVGNSATSDTSIAFGLNNSSTATGAVAIGSGIVNTISQSLQLGPSDASKMTILNNGNVGIGTSSPADTLNVRGGVLIQPTAGSLSSINLTGGSGVIKIVDHDDTGYTQGYISFEDAVGSLIGRFGSYDLYNGIGDPTAFGLSAKNNLRLDTNGATRLLITPTGNVGIGTSTPTSALQVTNGSIVSTNVANTVAYINFGAGNVQTTSTAATAIKLCGMKDGGSYTLILTGIAAASTVTITAYPTYDNTTSCSGAAITVDLGAGATTFATAGVTNILSFVYIAAKGVYGIPATNYSL
jgi:hypothetical protein